MGCRLGGARLAATAPVFFFAGGSRGASSDADSDADFERLHRGWVEHEDGMQLALALSSSITEAGLPVEREGQRRREQARAAPAAAPSSSHDVLGLIVDDDDDDEPCFGSCIGLDTDFVGEPRGRPDASQPNGGWGFMPCCGNRVHFDCLGHWLRPDDAEEDAARRSRCPFGCKKTLSRSSRRMLDGRRGPG